MTCLKKTILVVKTKPEKFELLRVVMVVNECRIYYLFKRKQNVLFQNKVLSKYFNKSVIAFLNTDILSAQKAKKATASEFLFSNVLQWLL